jgi:hypothetical protein
MARVVMQPVVTVDGYITHPDDTVGPLFDRYFKGGTELSAEASDWTFHVSRTSAEYIQPIGDAIRVTHDRPSVAASRLAGSKPRAVPGLVAVQVVDVLAAGPVPARRAAADNDGIHAFAAVVSDLRRPND